MIVDPLDLDPPHEHDVGMIVQHFTSAANQLVGLARDPEQRRHLTAKDRRDVLTAAEEVRWMLSDVRVADHALVAAE